MAVELIIGIVLVSLLAGVGIGYYLLGAGRANKAKAVVAELETALGTAQAELADYKRDVFGQFAQTAEKFRALDKSYNDLHRQLAESSVALCGDDGTLLLESPAAQSLDIVDEQPVDEEIVIAEAAESEEAQTEAAPTEAAGTAEEADTASESGQSNIEVEVDAAEFVAQNDPDSESDSGAEAHDAQVLVDNITVQDPDPVPTLTEVESTSNRRESA